MWRRNNPQWHSASPEKIDMMWENECGWKKETKWYAFAKVAIHTIKTDQQVESN